MAVSQTVKIDKPNPEDAKFVPLTMSGEVIGRIYFDLATGEIIGDLYDPTLGELLTVLFTEGVAEVSFLGKAAMPLPAAVEKLKEYRSEKESYTMTDAHEIDRPALELGHPEPPHETAVGNDSIPADTLAEAEQETLIQEAEVSTDE